jgi:hypothetical protein
MKRPPLNKVLIAFITKNQHKHSWFRRVSLYGIAEDWSPETVGRCLRDLAEKGTLEVGYYDGKYSKGLARYRLPIKNK